MKSLLFYWDVSEVFVGKKISKRLLKQWSHTAKAFGVSRLIIIGKNIPKLLDAQIKIEVYESYSKARSEIDAQFVVIIESGKPLNDVIFPEEETVFVVGSNYSDPEVNDGDITVSIEAGIPLWDIMAATIVLHKANEWH